MSEKVTIKVERKKLHLPTIALRGLVVFPNNLVHFEVGREKSIAAVEWAMANNSNVFLVAQKSMDTTDILSARYSSPVVSSTTPTIPAARAACWRILSRSTAPAVAESMLIATVQSVR